MVTGLLLFVLAFFVGSSRAPDAGQWDVRTIRGRKAEMPDTAVVEVPQTSTPASSSPTSSTPASAPATSATATTPTTPPASERPKDAASLSKFLQSEAAAADATPQPPLVADSAAAAITPPVGDGTPGAALPKASQGPIPFEVHQTALTNARTKAVTEYRSQHGWAADVPQRLIQSGISQEQFTEWVQASRAMAADPVKFFSEKMAELQNHPVYGAQIRSTAGRTLASAPAQMPQADVQVVDQAGNVVGMTYSDKQQALKDDFLRQQMTGEFRQMVQPLLTEQQLRIKADADQKRAAAVAENTRQLNAAADDVMTTIDGILHLPKDASKEQRDALYAKVDAEVKAKPGTRAEHAALAVYTRDILPTLQASAEATALDTQRKKAAGNTANGTGRLPANARPTNAKELAAFMAEHEGA